MPNLKVYTAAAISCILVISCNSKKDINQKNNARDEIAKAEKDFEKMAKEKGIMEAFWYFADSNAVIKRANDSLIKGKDGIRNYYSDPYFKTASVTWVADYIDASESSDMGYSYGSYIWLSKDSTGETKESKGIFHTVWKKQADGSWKYVWD